MKPEGGLYFFSLQPFSGSGSRTRGFYGQRLRHNNDLIYCHMSFRNIIWGLIMSITRLFSGEARLDSTREETESFIYRCRRLAG